MKKLTKLNKYKKGITHLIINLALTLNLLAVFRSMDNNKFQRKIEQKNFRLYIIIPVICILIAEIFIFFNMIMLGGSIHIGILIFLSISNIFLNDPKIHKIYMPLMLLPVLRILTISVPSFFDDILYILIIIYSLLAIPVIHIIIHQRKNFEDIGINKKNLLFYLFLSLPLCFLLGLGEYLILKTDPLIFEITFVNILKLTLVMFFLIGLIEELIFRSILQIRLEKSLNEWEALMITSVLFGFMHSGYGTFYEILYTMFVGFVIGFLFFKTKSLPFAVFVHGFANIFLFGIFPYYSIG